MKLIARPGSLQAVLDFVRKAAEEASLPEDRVAQLDLIIEEIVMNISRYAYPEGAAGDFTISYSIPAAGGLQFEIIDQGREFDLLAASAPDLTLDIAGRPVGGLGILLIRSFADSLSYRREQELNRLTFAISAR